MKVWIVFSGHFEGEGGVVDVYKNEMAAKAAAQWGNEKWEGKFVFWVEEYEVI